MKIQQSVLLLLISSSFTFLMQATLFKVKNLYQLSVQVEFVFSNGEEVYHSPRASVPLRGEYEYNSAGQVNNSRLHMVNLYYTFFNRGQKQESTYKIDMKNVDIKTNVQRVVEIEVYNQGLIKIVKDNKEEVALKGEVVNRRGYVANTNVARIFKVINLSQSSDKLSVDVTASNGYVVVSPKFVPLYGTYEYINIGEIDNAYLKLVYSVNSNRIVYKINLKDLGIKPNMQRVVQIKVYDKGWVKIVKDNEKEFGLKGDKLSGEWPTEYEYTD